MAYTIVMAVAAALLIILAVIFMGMWVYKDAKQKALPAKLWTLFVLLGGNFIGLILYLLVGRKQERVICDNCSASSNAGVFCSACGERLNKPTAVHKSNKNYLIACIMCFVLAFAMLVICLFSVFNADGFTPNMQYASYSYGSHGTARNLSINSHGNEWTISFDELSAGYALRNSYKSSSEPLSLYVDMSRCNGSMRLTVTQNDFTIDEIIKEGSYSFDLSGFQKEKITMKITNIDATDSSLKLRVETSD